jgi:hypothetical protein
MERVANLALEMLDDGRKPAKKATVQQRDCHLQIEIREFARRQSGLVPQENTTRPYTGKAQRSETAAATTPAPADPQTATMAAPGRDGSVRLLCGSDEQPGALGAPAQCRRSMEPWMYRNVGEPGVPITLTLGRHWQAVKSPVVSAMPAPRR